MGGCLTDRYTTLLSRVFFLMVSAPFFCLLCCIVSWMDEWYDGYGNANESGHGKVNDVVSEGWVAVPGLDTDGSMINE
jgi:hypothetical protein